MDWHWATVAVMSVLAATEAAGGYFAFQQTIIDRFGDLDDRATFPARWWMHPWIGFTWIDVDAHGNDIHTRWRRFEPEPWLIARGVVRVLAACFFVARFACTGGFLWFPAT